MGRVVKGSPTNSPLTAGPQRRPANVTEPINNGVINSLKDNIIMSYKLSSPTVCVTGKCGMWLENHQTPNPPLGQTPPKCEQRPHLSGARGVSHRNVGCKPTQRIHRFLSCGALCSLLQPKTFHCSKYKTNGNCSASRDLLSSYHLFTVIETT